MSVGLETMGRPKVKRSAQSLPEREERETIINMKGSPEYVAWLDAIHRKTHIPKVQIVRLAITLWAKENGHPLPPEI